MNEIYILYIILGVFVIQEILLFFNRGYLYYILNYFTEDDLKKGKVEAFIVYNVFNIIISALIGILIYIITEIGQKVNILIIIGFIIKFVLYKIYKCTRGKK